MNPTLVREKLQALAPDLPDHPTRFERVRDRVRRRRRRKATTLAAAITVTIVATPLAVHVLTASSQERTIGPSDTHHAHVRGEAAPGSDKITPLADALVTPGTGTQTVQLGARPTGATSVTTELTCLTRGRVRWPDGAALSCITGRVPDTATYTVDLDRGQDSFVVSARAGVQWRIRTTYVRVEPTKWGVNENGDTYGVRNDSGYPDLLAVVATNGRLGYVYNDDLEHATGGDANTPEEALQWQQNHGNEQQSLPVYKSDGVTQVGEFVIAAATGGRQP